MQENFDIYANDDIDVNHKPYKKIETLGKNKALRFIDNNIGQTFTNTNYNVEYGKIKDAKLAKQLGSDNAYFLTAQRDFDIVSNKGKKNQATTNIAKGTVSGPIVVSKDLKKQEKQIAELNDLANSSNQSFWLDSKSSLKGDFNIPKDTAISNSQIEANGNLNLNNTWINDSVINASFSDINITNTGINDCRIIDAPKRLQSAKKGAELNKTQLDLDGNLMSSAVIANAGGDTDDKTKVKNSYLENTQVIGINDIENTIILNDLHKTEPNVVSGSTLDKNDFIGANNRFEITRTYAHNQNVNLEQTSQNSIGVLPVKGVVKIDKFADVGANKTKSNEMNEPEL